MYEYGSSQLGKYSHHWGQEGSPLAIEEIKFAKSFVLQYFISTCLFFIIYIKYTLPNFSLPVYC